MKKIRTQPNLTMTALTYAGALPLVAAVLFVLITHQHPFWPQAYAAVILAFLAGFHWNTWMLYPKRLPRTLLYSSNVVALWAWLCLCLHNVTYGYLGEIIGFAYQLTIDGKLTESGVWPQAFWPLRQKITAVVIICLMVLALAS